MSNHSERNAVFCSECMDLLRELGAPVKYIVLPSHAYEHKVRGASCQHQTPVPSNKRHCGKPHSGDLLWAQVYVPPFQRRFPNAQVYVSPACAPPRAVTSGRLCRCFLCL